MRLTKRQRNYGYHMLHSYLKCVMISENVIKTKLKFIKQLT